jgi:hypothetical protein
LIAFLIASMDSCLIILKYIKHNGELTGGTGKYGGRVYFLNMGSSLMAEII